MNVKTGMIFCFLYRLLREVYARGRALP